MTSNNLKEELASLRINHSARGGGSRRGVWVVVALGIVAAVAGGWAWSNRDAAVEVKTATIAAQSGGAGGRRRP